jgi:predicted nucleic acid-binding protein
MTSHVLDTSALLTLHYNEPGSDRVAEILAMTLEPSKAQVVVFGCLMSLMELFYRVWKNEGEAQGRKAYFSCQALPITWVHETPGLLELAARMKASFQLSLGDAWIAATALQCDAVLIHKDPEFESVSELQQELLPYK